MRALNGRGLAFLCAAGLVSSAGELRAQCDPSLRGTAGATGYRQRSYGCEGLYVALQSAPLGVQVVSLIKGSVPQQDETRLRVHPPPGLDMANLAPQVSVVGRAQNSTRKWALNSYTRRDSVMVWDLDSVVNRIPLGFAELGLHGRTSRRSGVGPPIYVPLAITPVGTMPQPGDSLELVLRILNGTDAYVMLETKRHDPGKRDDSYFTFRLPADLRGERLLRVHWRNRKGEWGEPELIRIFGW